MRHLRRPPGVILRRVALEFVPAFVALAEWRLAAIRADGHGDGYGESEGGAEICLMRFFFLIRKAPNRSPCYLNATAGSKRICHILERQNRTCQSKTVYKTGNNVRGLNGNSMPF